MGNVNHGCGGFSSIGAILVLFILLFIIAKTFCF
ncbi:YjcZ family sporulation protein [Paenibacillus sp. GCM10027627]